MIERLRRYNEPTTSEVAGIIPNAEHEIMGRREFVLHRKGKLISNEKEVLGAFLVSHRSYNLYIRVLLNSFSQDVWHIQITTLIQHSQPSSSRFSSKKTTATIFSIYHLYCRPNDLNMPHRGCQLLQQYTVTQFCRVESKRLSYLRQLQQMLRVADYETLCEQRED